MAIQFSECFINKRFLPKSGKINDLHSFETMSVVSKNNDSITGKVAGKSPLSVSCGEHLSNIFAAIAEWTKWRISTK